MRTRDSSFPVAAAVTLLFASTVAGGCAHVTATPSAAATPPPAAVPPVAAAATPAPAAVPKAAAVPNAATADSGAPARQRPAWIGAAPASRVVAVNTRDERRCRREAPLGSRVERIVCRTEAEERLRAEAAAERVRWGTSPTF